jgi:aminoglycoside phosphotransferase family enzyme/predicted kinase
VPPGEAQAREAEAVARALADPATYGDAPQRVEHVQTHISHVFLVGPWVYKLKKPVTFPFLDFGTVEKRRHFCEEEVRLNRRLAAGVYLGVVPVTRAHDGRLRLDGEGRVVDHVVWMRRLPRERLLPALLDAGAVGGEAMDALAARLAAFHAAATADAEVAAHGAPERLAAAWAENLADAAPFAGDLLAAEDLEILADFGPRFVRTHDTLLRARQQRGRIREGHGDLHAEHVCLLAEPAAEPGLAPLPAGIYVFDCIEFSRALRCTDVAAEIAFLAMDLERRGRPDLADRFAAAYAAAADDPDVASLLPFYVCARACVRGKVEGLKAAEPEVEPAERDAARGRARRFFALAQRHAWRAAGPLVVAVAGPSGCGKSTLAALLAEATGFAHVSTDVLRRRRAGLGPTQTAAAPWGAGLYTPQARSATYAALSAEADGTLAAGRGVVVDATWMRRADRDRLAGVARARRRPLVFLDCRADEATIRARLEAREREPSVSDARWDTYVAQRRAWEPFAADEPCLAVDTGGSAAAARAAALRLLWPWAHGRAPAAAHRPSDGSGRTCSDTT